MRYLIEQLKVSFRGTQLTTAQLWRSPGASPHARHTVRNDSLCKTHQEKVQCSSH